MMLLSEFGLVPDVFDAASYSSEELADVHLRQLKEALIEEGVVRNLRNGEWLQTFSGDTRVWHRRGKELLKKLKTQNRLRPSPPCLSNTPTDDRAWCTEALDSHKSSPLRGIVASDATCEHYRKEPTVASITKLANAPWWTSRSPSVRLSRTLADYERHLALVLASANSAMLIDPHLDPRQRRYGDVITLLEGMRGRTPVPLIEVHRVCYFDTRDKRNQHDIAGWQNMFQPWVAPLREAGLSAEVFIWDDFHDRYIITDLIGIVLPNGLDTTADANALTTWSRLGRPQRDDIQREFDPASNRHSLRGRFKLP
ncbi:MAG: hypothetical protein KIT24_11655 [Phycisphaeraceae bacterium]|nr:hypothetical protein [Phycisphaeraceae bacterium]